MHIVSDESLQRAGYIYSEDGVGYSASNRPSINWKHIDGPLLYYRDGQMHWLTLWERLRCWLGWDGPESIERKRRPDLIAHEGRAALIAATEDMGFSNPAYVSDAILERLEKAGYRIARTVITTVGD